ncbi:MULTISPECIES: DUF2946 domain-containing protein [unclassified Pseudomonas]|uniref:DUF2946 domain-containing protein n=1 Tax=unclassified Pseudomonas TaxID=196821 RepID=UPI002AC9725D|nr:MULTISPECIES: DUF2946 domain-containing protein [unclassified Pseudomonas]MEB0040961.1 DUF2946 domain-containing protein [Pseudomonas sp. MH10]MEB0121753.1 DUF2946 domain-containing protein [Pseudomonas sp. CCI1.2]WPX61991.1 DUF2946 domain-containing protein [Pseudomonas sp. MH10]
MSRRRLAFAWIACFAVLFNMFAMPMTSAAPKTVDEALLWGSFCSASGTRLVAISLGKTEQSLAQKDDHAAMQHCWCCAGSAPLVSVPSGFTPWYALQAETTLAREVQSPSALSPRQQWPSLNPRAPPRA